MPTIIKEFSLDLLSSIAMDQVKGQVLTMHHEPVRFFSFSAKGERPIVGVVDTGEEDLAMQWTVTGKRNPERLHTQSVYDLHIEIEEE